MKGSSITFTIAVCLNIASVANAAVLRTEVNPANGHAYYLLGISTWTDAEAEAVSLGGHLATVNNQAEQDWIWTTFSGLEDKNLWIGLTDRELYGFSEGNFGWVSGAPVTYTNWAPGEPSGGEPAGDADFVHMWRATAVGGTGVWNDRPNDGAGNPHHGLVEIPEPSSLALLSLIALLVPYRLRRGNVTPTSGGCLVG